MFYQTWHKLHAGHQKDQKCRCFPWWPWSLTLIFKLVWARDQTHLPHVFGADPFSGSQDISYTNKKNPTDWRRQIQNLPQFTACDSNNGKSIYLAHWGVEIQSRWYHFRRYWL